MDDLGFAKDLAIQAGELLVEYFQAFGIQSDLKEDRSVVTKADLAADQLIYQKIQAAYPEDVIMSEELHPGIPGEDNLGQRAVWIIDPLDGTTNFSLGLPIWGTLITRLEKGIPQLTAMFFPMLGELYTAHRNQGAWLNEYQLQLQAGSDRRTQPFFACCSRTYRHFSVSIPHKTRILGSSAYTFNMVARGMAIVGFEATPKIWDIAGSWLVVQEAGGAIETMDGDEPFPLKTEVNYAATNFPTLAASTKDMAAWARMQIRPKALENGLKSTRKTG